MTSVTATKAKRALGAALLTSLLLTGVGCRSRSAPTSGLSELELTPQACLQELDLSQLNQALNRCNQVVKAHRSDPAPLTDRSLLHTLLGQIDEACLDVNRALTLVKDQGKAADPMISHELKVRQASCKQRKNMAGKG
ncbi:hypothetical protein [Synechococcus sp. UW140]|uniref:hypothetical protein n=1 Tax=Synechococcus sp. UW140 TaxID=368503 RepID=UPI001FCB1D41|nr:hypothetical protein [Synechococcus sp. UW140]